MGRTAWTVAGGIVGAYFGYPQLGMAIGGAIGSVVDPDRIAGPRIGETSAQTSQEGAPRPIIYGTAPVFGNVISSGPLIKQDVETEGEKGGPVTSTEHCYRTYAIRICEGQISGITRVWEDEKLVYDIRPGSLMLAESTAWIFGCNLYLGDETQLPDTFLEILVSGIGETPAYRGTAYIVFVGRDLTDRRGSIPQYRFEVAQKSGDIPWDFTWTETVFTEDESGPARAIAVSPLGEMNIATHTLEIYSSEDGQYWIPALDSAPSGHTMIYSDATQVWTAPTGNTGVPKMHHKIGAAAWESFSPTVGYPPQENTDPYQSGVWAADRFIAVGNSIRSTGGHEYITSADGVNWSVAPSGARGWIGVTYSPSMDRLVAVNGSDAGYSDDRGDTWVDVTTPGVDLSSVVWSPELALFVAMGTVPAWSADGVSWTAGTWDGPATTSFAIAWAPERGIFVAPGGPSSQYFAVSNDGKVWVRRDAGVTFAATQRPQTVVWNPAVGKFFFAAGTSVYSSNTETVSSRPILLSEIVSDIHARCGLPAANADVSELTDLVDGLVLAGDYTGADAIDTLRAPYFFDKYEADKKIRYPKRGAAVVATLTIDDLVEEPDELQRKQAIEYPKKIHLAYQHAASGYAAVKATYSRSSPDARVVGEVTTQVPIVLDEDEAAQIVHKMFKIAYAEAQGEVMLSVPESLIWITPTDNIGLSLRGAVSRLRIEKADHADGVLKWTLKHDRQSAYTSALTGIPIPPPTLPPSTITGSTVLAVMDIGSRVDSEDDLHILYAVTGGLPGWYGALVQRSLDGGATYANAASIGRASIMGSLIDAVPSASEFYTDTTNSVRVQLYRDTQTIESLTIAQFSSEGGAFALEKADGSFEILQYRDAVDEGGGEFLLSIMHRGLLNSGTSVHLAGALFVMLDRATHVAMESAWIGQALTHRAPSFDQAAEIAAEQTETYVGRSQLEWPVAYLTAVRGGADVITATWTPRHRFGSDDAPVASSNFQGYRVTLDDGALPAVIFDTTSATFTYDASALGSPLTVSVSALNRITGVGPASSESI